MPSNYKTKVCKQFSEEPFYCTYGEKCQFIHINSSLKNQTSNSHTKYIQILNGNLNQMNQMNKRTTHLEDPEDFEVPSLLLKNKRLSVFKSLTDNCADDCEIQPYSSNETHLKKPTLSKGSREFHMPSTKVKQASLLTTDKVVGRDD